MVRDQLGPGQQEQVDCSAVYFDHFAKYFANKTTCIYSDLESALTASRSDDPRVPLWPVVRNTFELVQSEDVDRIHGRLATRLNDHNSKYTCLGFLPIYTIGILILCFIFFL